MKSTSPSPSPSNTSTTPTDELKPVLQRLGFTDHEARAYIALTDSPDPVTAYEVAQRSGLPRANAYGVLASLAAKGAIQEVTREPTRYAAVNTDEYFRQRANQTSDLCDQASRMLKERAPAQEAIYVWAYRGKKPVSAKLHEMIESSTDRIWLKGPLDILMGYRDALIAAAQRNVKVTLIVFGDDIAPLGRHKNLTVFLHEGRGANRGASKVVLTVTADGSSFMIASFTDDLHASYGRNPSIVYVVETMILHEIYLAEMYASIGPTLDDLFDEHFGKLRSKYRPSDMGSNMLSSMRGSETEALLPSTSKAEPSTRIRKKAKSQAS
ncbi:TrmB family transcriptional regulator [Variovorax sp. Root434]|uniref:TrmB family transcriptional regulator n=1 Tax=Variovorax sp. Root434 TaxID=1736536 RepID=UPI000701A61F|nr:TrmB family transcriptional regulator [Variovorax sp. Root434]KQX31964.1 hypothetical protein ASD05_27930 [Variovorax sp. Root434]